MSGTNENRRPLSIIEGKVFIDGIEIIDSAKISIVYKPKLWEGKVIGDRGTNRRWLGGDITGSIEAFKTTPRYVKIVKDYMKDGKTPVLTIQGIRSDEDSDYFDDYGSESITLTGVVITGDINLLTIDTSGDVVKETITFGAKNMS